MPYYQWDGSGPFRDHANDRVVEVGDTVAIAEAVADPQPGFERVDESEVDLGSVDDVVDEYVNGHGDEGELEDDLEDTFESKMEQAESLADENYQVTVAAVEGGEADKFLTELEQVDDRNSVQSAIQERRDELE